MTQYYINDGATGTPDGLTPETAWLSIADVTGITSAGHTITFAEGSGPYYEAFALPNSNITWEGNGVTVSGGIDLNAVSGGEWHQSVTSGEWYFTASGGADPSLTEPECGTVDGYYCGESTGLVTERERAGAANNEQVGGMTTNKQFGWMGDAGGAGDLDSLNFNTIYVKLDVNPSTVEIIMAQLAKVMDVSFVNNQFNDFTFSYANTNLVTPRYSYVFNHCAFNFVDDRCIEIPANSVGTYTFNHCTSYWGGHSMFIISNTGATTININNCIALYPHLFLLASTTVSNTVTLNMRNCILYAGQAGALDIRTGAATQMVLNENNNCWHAVMIEGVSNDLANGQTEWATTDATDLPASLATTENDVNNLVDPLLVNVDPLRLANVDFSLQAGSPCIDSGVKYWTGPNPVGVDGEPFSDFDTSMGAYQSKDTPFHPTQL